jgi:hypothetical protein
MAAMALLTATLATQAAASGSAATHRIVARSVWTLERTGTGCENDTFSRHHRFASAITDGSGNGGTFSQGTRLTMKWTSGQAAGAVFDGQWLKATDQYTGLYSLNGQTASATLAHYVAGACLSASTLTAHPTSSTIPLGHTDTDSATVYGSGDVAPTGTIAFYVCRGDTSACTVAAGSALTSVALTGSGGAATATSAVDTPAATGSYCFLAVYSGDNNYATSSDGSTADQCFEVTGGGAATAASRSNRLGTAPASATRITAGSIWTLDRRGGNCEAEDFGPAHRFSAAVVNGSGNTGTYRGQNTLHMRWTTGSATGVVYQGRWRSATAEYTGTLTGAGTKVTATLAPDQTDPCADLEAQPEAASVSIGDPEADGARMTGLGGPTPTGTVHFYLCPGDSSPCTPGATGAVDLGTTALTVSGGSSSAGSAFDDDLAEGSYCYLAVYSGDSHYPAVSADSISDQCFAVTAPQGT